MATRFGAKYVDGLFADPSYGHLAELSACMCGSPAFEQNHVTYGFPEQIFVFVECLLWFAQSTRSGTWTYFEATDPPRQTAMCDALEQHGPAGFAEMYRLGMANWTDHSDESAIERVDKWIANTDKASESWMWSHLKKHRSDVDRFMA